VAVYIDTTYEMGRVTVAAARDHHVANSGGLLGHQADVNRHGAQKAGVWLD